MANRESGKDTRPSGVVLFTDLDGSLLDLDTGSAAAARPALARVQALGVPIVFCSAKTRAEQEVLRRELDVHDPFIVENGGPIVVPHRYFPFPLGSDRAIAGYEVVELGLPYGTIRTKLERVRAALDLEIIGFGDLSVEEVADRTGLSVEAAERARDREYDETVFLDDVPEEMMPQALKAFEAVGLDWAHAGRFHHVFSGSNKGRAVRTLIKLFERDRGSIRTIGIGDSANDEAMLGAVDTPVLVQQPDGRWESLRMPRVRRFVGRGPEGWAQAVSELVLAKVG